MKRSTGIVIWTLALILASVMPASAQNDTAEGHAAGTLLDPNRNHDLEPPAQIVYGPTPQAAPREPERPFFEEIETLAAAGISDDACDEPGGFCPDGVLTRAQIAALLVEALGLGFQW